MRFNLEAFTRFEPLRGRVEELAARLCDLAEQHATVKWESVSHIFSDEQKNNVTPQLRAINTPNIPIAHPCYIYYIYIFTYTSHTKSHHSCQV